MNGESLTFDIVFGPTFFASFATFEDLIQTVFFDTGTDSGKGFGGGELTNVQVAVSFQQLGYDGEDSGLIGSLYAGGGTTTVPEAQTIYMFLVGLGLLGLVSMLRRRPRQIRPLPAFASAAVAVS